MPISQGNRHYPGASLVGALTSLILHALLLAPALLGLGSTKNRDSDQSVGLGKSIRDDPTMTMVWIEDSDQAQLPQRSAYRIAALPPVEDTLLVSVSPPPFLPAVMADLSNSDSHDDGAASETQVGADAGYVLMLGRYVNQINARVERAWVRPRKPIESDLFRCRARIMQAPNGEVKEIELDSCNGDAAWQMSLVRAIQSASPLPAPPDPKVFSRRLILDFHSRAFSADQGPEGFEPPTQTAMK